MPTTTATIVEPLPCALSAHEKMLKADKLVDVLREVGKLEDAKKDAAAGFKQKIDGKNVEARILAGEIRTGAEFRPVECVERPRYGDMMVDLVRLDTGAVVSSRAMHPSERQLALDAGGGEALEPVAPDNDNGGGGNASPADKRRRRLAKKRDDARVMVEAAGEGDVEAGDDEAGDDGDIVH